MEKLSRLMLWVAAMFIVLALSVGEAKAAEIVETGKSGETTYTLYSDGVLVFSGKGSTGYLDIEDPTFPKKIIFEEGIECISAGTAEMGYVSVEEVVLPSTLMEFGYMAFDGTPWREKLEEKDGMVTYENILISVNEKVEKVVIPKHITVIAEGAFMSHSYIKEIVLHDDIKSVGSLAFDSLNSNEVKLYVPKKIKYIGDIAFRGCEGIENIDIEEGIRRIGLYTFLNCRDLKTVVLPSTVASIDSRAFAYNNNLVSFKIYSEDVIYEEDVFYKTNNVNILCCKNSTTEAYAKEYNIPYKYFYYVNFANTAGTKVERRERLSGETVGTLPTLKRTGYNFKGWYTAKTGGTKVTSTTKVTSDTTIYAQWEMIKPGKVTGLKQGANSTKYIKMSWSPVSGATGYYVYRKDSANGTYKKIATTTKTSYTNKNLKAGVKYYYMVQAYKTLDGVTVTGTASAARTMITRPAAPKITKISPWTKRATVFWSGVSGADGYEIYMSTSKTGTYKKIATCTAAKRQYKKTGLKTGKKYYFKIKSYKLNAAGKKVYSYSYSKVMSIVVK